MAHPLADVDVFLFDVFGTVVDWQNSVAQELQSKHYDGILERKCPIQIRLRLLD